MSSTTSDAVSHPSCCRSCRGCGYVPGPPITVQLAGRLHEEPTVQPCEHKWWWDDPSPDEPITLAEYRRRLKARAAAGDADASAELKRWAQWLRKHGSDGLSVLG